MTDIDSNRDTNETRHEQATGTDATRMDQDNEKNTTSPIRGGAGAPDIDERNRADAPRRGDDVVQTDADATDTADRGGDRV